MGLLQNKSEGQTGRIILRQLLFAHGCKAEQIVLKRASGLGTAGKIYGKYGGDYAGKD